MIWESKEYPLPNKRGWGTVNGERELEVLLNLVCECLRKVSGARCEIDFLGKAVYCRGWCCSRCGSWERFVILGTEMGVKVLFSGLKVGTRIKIVTAICKATI